MIRPITSSFTTRECAYERSVRIPKIEIARHNFRRFIDRNHIVFFFLFSFPHRISTHVYQQTSQRHIGSITPRILILLQNVNTARTTLTTHRYAGHPVQSNDTSMSIDYRKIGYTYVNDTQSISANRSTSNREMRYTDAKGVSSLVFRAPDDASSRSVAQTRCAGITISPRILHSDAKLWYTPFHFFYANCIRVYTVVPTVITGDSSECICCDQREFFAQVDKIVVSPKASLCPRNYALHSIASVTKKTKKKNW